ncbi:hypothetical protein Golob_006204 [Gossypium lobatum]|uniref:Uncharacterized protein n=1 Tax=Gossypium lobatum TaxID=34289 RepID=A0A7J8MVS2_9ROSI|nr:hypothetical protein [Gossypium lobatum]
MQPELLLVKRTLVSKVVLAWDFYQYPGPIYQYNQSATNTLRTSTKTIQVSS